MALLFHIDKYLCWSVQW